MARCSVIIGSKDANVPCQAGIKNKLLCDYNFIDTGGLIVPI